MNKVYLLVYSDQTGTREEMKAWLSAMPEVVTWRYDLPHSFYIISPNAASELSAALRTRAGNKGRFIIAEITANRNGWLPPDTWYLLNNRVHKPKA